MRYLQAFLISLVATVLTARQRYQTSILESTVIGLCAFALIMLCPFFGPCGKWLHLAGLMAYGVGNVIYMTSWQPLLNTFLSDERRSLYLGKMRFTWQLCTALFLFLVSRIIGKNPPAGYLQLVMVAGFIVFSGRLLCISSVPTFRRENASRQKFHFKEGILLALFNKPLAGFSVYIFVLNLFAFGTLAMNTLYLKNGLHAPASIIVLMSSISLLGQLTGSFSTGRLIHAFGTRPLLLILHTTFALTNLWFFFMGRGLCGDHLLYTLIAVAVFIHSFMIACADVTSTNEMMHLATPGNEVVAMAFCNGFNYAGRALSSLLSSLILGAGFLADEWVLGRMHGLRYQSIFLISCIGIVFAYILMLVVPAIFPGRNGEAARRL